MDKKYQYYYAAIQNLCQIGDYKSVSSIIENMPLNYICYKQNDISLCIVKNLHNFKTDHKTRLENKIKEKKKELFLECINKDPLSLVQYQFPDHFFKFHDFYKKIKIFENYRAIVFSMENKNMRLKNNSTIAHHMTQFLTKEQLIYFEEQGVDFWKKDNKGLYPIHYSFNNLESKESVEAFLYLLDKACQTNKNLNMRIHSITEKDYMLYYDYLINSNKIKFFYRKNYDKINKDRSLEMGFFTFMVINLLELKSSYDVSKGSNQEFILEKIMLNNQYKEIVDFNDSTMKKNINVDFFYNMCDLIGDSVFSLSKENKAAYANYLNNFINKLIDYGYPIDYKNQKNNTFLHALAKGPAEAKEIFINLVEKRNDLTEMLNAVNNNNKTPIQSINKKVLNKYLPRYEKAIIEKDLEIDNKTYSKIRKNTASL